jgi:prophage tail gpP-like protein
MIIEVNGTQYSGWTNAVANVRLDTIADAFSFTATAQDGKPLPFKGGEDCSVFVDELKVLTGHIEIVNVDGNSSAHDITIDGRSSTGDVLDSKIGALPDIRPPVSLARVISLVLSHLGSPVKVVDEVKPSLFTKAEDLAAPEPGQDAFEFIQALARKKQVLLSSDADGNLLITKSSGTEIDATIHHRVNNNDNNVIQYSVSYDTTGRYNRYRLTTQLNPLSLVDASSSSNPKIADQSSEVLDTLIRVGRQFVLVSENAGSNPLDRARWEANIRKARGRVYGCTVHGYRNQSGDIWRVNNLVQVIDEFAGINSRMLLNTIQYSLDVDNGRLTTMTFVEKNAYTLELEEPDTDVVEDGF